MRTELFNKIGGFDEKYFMYLEDADLSDRIRKYGKIIYNPDFSVTHNWDGGSAKSFKLLKYHLKSMRMYFKNK
jgi:GT2 family glycosyltransferase